MKNLFEKRRLCQIPDVYVAHFSAQKIISNDQIKKFKCPGNVFMVHIYINTALDMFKKDDVGSHSLPKRDLHFGGQVPVYTKVCFDHSCLLWSSS